MLICMILTAVLLLGIAVFAFTDPKGFVRWMAPYYWLTRRFFRTKPDRWDRSIAYSNGVFVVIALIGLSFFLGAWFTTAFFHLWNSPLAGIVFPQY